MAPSPFAQWPPSTGIFVLLPLFPSHAAAALPFGSSISQPVLKHSNEVSFDPLGVAAVLSNPRAETSAARLYAQPDRAIFRWPHMMMIGGALTPVSVVADYLTSKFSSIDPAVSMCLKDRIILPIRSTMVFPDLPISLSNAWMRDILAFKPSHYPENDFVVAHVEDSFIQPHLGEPHAIQTLVLQPGLTSSNMVTPTAPIPISAEPETRPAPFTVLDLLALIGGLLILTGLVFSTLTGDVWAITLFAIYALHWLASTLISFTPLVKLQPTKIVPNPSTQYCVYQRPEGGTVVFKGRKDTIERWARMTWIFDPCPWHHVLHWFWAGTGAAAAVASVACMVNMAAYLQLGFLGVLGYSSLAEILATQVARTLQARARERRRGAVEVAGEKGVRGGGSSEPTFVRGNRTRSMGIIKATLRCGLDGQMWYKLKLLPQIPVFDRMLELLDQLRMVEDERVMRSAVMQFVAGGEGEEGRKLAGRIAEEVEEAWKEMRVQQEV